ncbi:MAG: hypothetical protein DIU63_13100 [Proteobacteria bacterium]|nr:MAG: hypothetical protein DIU63_13100 [Pseudomonadota bacterium]
MMPLLLLPSPWDVHRCAERHDNRRQRQKTLAYTTLDPCLHSLLPVWMPAIAHAHIQGCYAS